MQFQLSEDVLFLLISVDLTSNTSFFWWFLCLGSGFVTPTKAGISQLFVWRSMTFCNRDFLGVGDSPCFHFLTPIFKADQKNLIGRSGFYRIPFGLRATRSIRVIELCLQRCFCVVVYPKKLRRKDPICPVFFKMGQHKSPTTIVVIHCLSATFLCYVSYA